MTQPYGTWLSPLTASAIASQAIGLSAASVDRGVLYWLESRPQEGGRQVVVRLADGKRVDDVTPPGTNVRTRVHEYGGGSYLVSEGEVFFVDFTDQRVYRLTSEGASVPVTGAGQARYADFAVDRSRKRLICVQEDHSSDGEPVNTLVSLSIEPSGDAARVLASGHDFYSSPRLAPDGRTLVWLAWRHPNMPWDGTELWVARMDDDGALIDPRIVAGGVRESICQPGWSPGGDLLFVSDRDGWWRFYRVAAEDLASRTTDVGDRATALLRVPPPETEFGRPQWTLASGTWACLDSSTIVTAYARHGRSALTLIDLVTRTCQDLPTDVEPLDSVTVAGREAIFVGGSPTDLPAVIRLNLDTGAVQRVRSSSSLSLDPTFVSKAEAIVFPTDDGRVAHAFHYPPQNPDCGADPDERPPLIVISHGGPTDAAKPCLRLSTQYWTTRGFAVVDVNYGGSTGFGREYRERLNGQWGIVDVADCVNAATFLVAQGKADGGRLIIRGGSAGGYTTLMALTSYPEVFKAGASYYGICDLEVLARDTHKFESRYTDQLVGPYPEARDVYRARSPIYAVDRLSCPLILFHGAEDKVVPPNQAELMASALTAKGLPVALMIFEGEQHGFRKAPTIVRSLEAELWFYGAVLGFTPADAIEPVEVVNLERDRRA